MKINVDLIQNILKIFFENVLLYCKETTIHCFYQFTKPRTFLEMYGIAWILTILICIFGCVTLVWGNWLRFLHNPSVVSLQKDFRNWNNIFPAHTFCLQDKVDEKKLKKYIDTTWGVKPSNKEQFAFYTKFVRDLSNLTYDKMDKLSEYASIPELNKINISDLIDFVHPDFTVKVISEMPVRNWTRISTELGICHSYNSVVDKYFIYKNSKKVQVDNSEDPITCHFFNRQCYARLESKPGWIAELYVHSPYETLDLGFQNPVILQQGINLEVSYKSIETHTTEELDELTPTQRRCRFFNEPLNDYPDPHIYTLTLCRLRCRQRYAVRRCKCYPHFYGNLKVSGYSICDLQGLICLSTYADDFIKSRLNCNCPQSCTDVNFVRDSEKIQKLTGYFASRASYRWALTPPTIRFQREVIFGYEDLIVSFGGIAAFLLGCSFLSFVEICYYLLRAVAAMYKYWRFYETQPSVQKVEPIKHDFKIVTRKMY